MSYTVTKQARYIIEPSESTPSEPLDLSVIDSLPALRCKVRTLHVYKRGQDAAHVIKVALSKALVHYYPLAGRLADAPSLGKMQVQCTGEGVWFVEASADCGLDAVNYLDNDLTDSRFNLLPDPPSNEDGYDPLVMMQVTQFVGDGFIIGLEFSHTICDGLGAAQFLNAVGELARGLETPTVTPVWNREALVAAPKLARAVTEPKPPPPQPKFKLLQSNIDISLDTVAHLKRRFSDHTGQTCSAFEAIAAILWRSRTLAMALESDATVTLVFFANVRMLVDPRLPDGYYGNCFFPMIVRASSGWMEGVAISEVVKLIQKGKATVASEFGRWMAGDFVDEEEGDPFAPPLDYTTLFVSEWGRLGFRSVDYGWGPPVNFVPIQSSNIVPVCVMGSPTLPMKGVRLMTWCLEEAHLAMFHDHLIINQSI